MIEEVRSLPIHEQSIEEQQINYTGRYKLYLQSKHWKATREFIINKYDGKCELCGKEKGINIHHLTYERLGEETENDLMCLCKKCHEVLHTYSTIPSDYTDSRECVKNLYNEYISFKDKFTNEMYMYCLPMYFKPMSGSKQLSEIWGVTELQARKRIKKYKEFGIVVNVKFNKSKTPIYLLRRIIFRWLMNDFPKTSKLDLYK